MSEFDYKQRAQTPEWLRNIDKVDWSKKKVGLKGESHGKGKKETGRG